MLEELDKRRSDFMTEEHFIHRGCFSRRQVAYEIYADEVKVLVLVWVGKQQPLKKELWLKKSSWKIDWCNFENNDIEKISYAVLEGNEFESVYEFEYLPSEVTYYDLILKPRMIEFMLWYDEKRTVIREEIYWWRKGEFQRII